ncbi:hypothetical protein Tco_0731202 [Tanacetum coccineum]
MDKMMLESQKWAGYQENLMTLELKVVSLEAEKIKLKVIEAHLREEIKTMKCDTAEVVSKVVPYVVMKLVHSDEMAVLVGRLVSSVIFYGICDSLKEVSKMKEPFDQAKVKGYTPSYKKEHTKDGNDLTAAVFQFLLEVTTGPFALVEALVSKKPKSLCRPTLINTTTLTPSAHTQQETLSSVPSLKPVSPPPKV